MNEHDPLPEQSAEDAQLRELLAPLRTLQSPLETQVGNRVAIAAELQRLRAERPAWWRRSIRVPLPIAASLLVAVVISLASDVSSWLGPVHLPWRHPTD